MGEEQSFLIRVRFSSQTAEHLCNSTEVMSDLHHESESRNKTGAPTLQFTAWSHITGRGPYFGTLLLTRLTIFPSVGIKSDLAVSLALTTDPGLRKAWLCTGEAKPLENWEGGKEMGNFKATCESVITLRHDGVCFIGQ